MRYGLIEYLVRTIHARRGRSNRARVAETDPASPADEAQSLGPNANRSWGLPSGTPNGTSPRPTKDSTARVLGWIGAVSGLLSAGAAIGAIVLALQTFEREEDEKVSSLMDKAWDTLGGADYTSRIATLHVTELERVRRLIDTASAIAPNDAGVLNVKAAWQIASNRSDDGIDTLRRALRRHPNNSTLLLNLAMVLRIVDQPEEAREIFTKVTKIAPDESDPYYGLGHIYLDKGEYKAAANAFLEAGKRDPMDADALFSLGLVSRAKGDWDDAIKYFRQAIGRSPGDPDFRFALASAYMHLGKPNIAERQLQEVVRLAPDHSDALSNLGVLLLAREADEEAEAVLTEATRVSPDNAAAYSNLGSSLAKQGKHTSAVDAFRIALDLEATADRYYNLGNSLVALESLAEAEAAFRSCLDQEPEHHFAQHNLAVVRARLEPRNPDVFEHLGDIHRTEGNWKAAVDAYLEAQRLGAREPQFSINLGRSLLAVDAKEDAVSVLREARNDAPDNAEVRNAFGIALDRAGDTEGAIEEFEVAVSLDPQPAGYHNLGNALVSKGQPAKAEEAFRRALELDRDYAKSHRSLGKLLAAFADGLDEAKQHMETAVRIEPTALSYNGLGVVQARMEEFEEACLSFRHAISLDKDFIDAHKNLLTALREAGLTEAADEHRARYSYLPLGR